jgi:hypothetical protein
VGLTIPPPSSAEVLEMSGAIPLLTLRTFVAYKKGETYLLLPHTPLKSRDLTVNSGHAQEHTLRRTFVDEGSARLRGLYLQNNTRQTSMPPAEFELSVRKREAAVCAFGRAAFRIG